MTVKEVATGGVAAGTIVIPAKLQIYEGSSNKVAKAVDSF